MAFARSRQLSVVIPLHNEEEVVGPTAIELLQTFALFAPTWEVIFVDDGSTDETFNLLGPFEKELPIRVVRLPKRMGQSAALYAGLAIANGSLIVTMDGDGQNDPKDIFKLLESLQDCDLVVGNRLTRQDSLKKRWFSRVGNFVRNQLTGSQIPDSGCGLKAFRREWIAKLIPINGMHRFIPLMVEIAGGRVVSVDVSHRPRSGGRSKYGIIDRLLIPFVDCAALAWLKRRSLPSNLMRVDTEIDASVSSSRFRIGTTASTQERADDALLGEGHRRFAVSDVVQVQR
jgi:dolichol-phosphate mannosyltransferase